jgi:molybdenum cofactor cytidylyltransferase
MMPLEECVVVLLCAGLSQRFGPRNKLLAPFDGKPLAAYAAELSTRVPFAGSVAVVPPDEPALRILLLEFGFDLVVNPDPGAGKDSSLRLGLARALALGARGALVLLGDMPHVTVAHLRALATAADDELAAISSAGNIMSPPTLVPAKAARAAIDPACQPVRASLGRPAQVAASASMLVDYDHPAQLGMAPGPEGNPAQQYSSEDR